MIELGDEVQDTITGFKGVAIGVTKWLTGCNRWIVQPKGVDPAGKIYETQSFDEPLLKVLKKKKSKEVNRSKGGPMPTPRKYN